MTLSEECGEEDSMEGTLPKEMLGSSGAAVGAESADGAFEILAAQEIPLPVVGGTEWAGAEEAVLCYGGEGEGEKERAYQGREVSIQIELVLWLWRWSSVETFPCGGRFRCPRVSPSAPSLGSTEVIVVVILGMRFAVLVMLRMSCGWLSPLPLLRNTLLLLLSPLPRTDFVTLRITCQSESLVKWRRPRGG
jgi:hypothetical protein